MKIIVMAHLDHIILEDKTPPSQGCHQSYHEEIIQFRGRVGCPERLHQT